MGQPSIIFTPLPIISHPQGNILHALKSSEASFQGLGEAYFSFIHPNEIKSWRKHLKMQVNLVVPVGKVKIVVYDDGLSRFSEFILSPEQYGRLTLSPGVWFAMQGLGEPTNLILNLASIEHDPTEVEKRPLLAFSYDWTAVI